jgi:putative addiction module component (TIGR02574 family)
MEPITIRGGTETSDVPSSPALDRVPDVNQLLQAALLLPDEDQLRLVSALTAAVEERGLRPFDDWCLGEIQRRSAQYDAGNLQPISWSEVKERARQQVSSRD